MTSGNYHELYKEIVNCKNGHGIKPGREKFLLCAKYGLLKHAVPSEFEGHGDSFIDFCHIYEDLGKNTQDTSLILSLHAHVWGSIFPIIKFGTEEQKKIIPQLLDGSIISGHAITEVEAGSDLSKIGSSATKVADGYIVNAHKKYITNAAIADLIIIYVRHGKSIIALIIKNNDKNVRFTSTCQLGSFNSPSTMGEVIVENALIPFERMVGSDSSKIVGSMMIQTCLELERAFIFSGILGVMDWQISKVIEYAEKRFCKDFITEAYQAISHKISDMKLRLDISRLLIHECARLKDQKKRIILQSSEAKLYASEAFLQSSLDALHIMGASGLEAHCELKSYINDAIAGRLMSGTSEIQRNIISHILGIK
jgi:alkylation response protein AidB-like acyl-CoA dehydrogenase